MTSSAGIIGMVLGGVLIFCVLIGGLVWLYSAQSAKRRKAFESTRKAKE
jgi:hypothetical protein